MQRMVAGVIGAETSLFYIYFAVEESERVRAGVFMDAKTYLPPPYNLMDASRFKN